MTDYIPIIVGLVGSAGLYGLIQFLIARYDKKNDRIKEVEKKIDMIFVRLDRNELATTRVQLIYLIDSDPSNKDAILKTAQRYFVELDGDGEAWDIFYTWAKRRKVNTSWYQMLIKKEQGRS